MSAMAQHSIAARASTDTEGSQNPVDLGAQSNLIGAPEPVSVRPIPADQNGGSASVLPDLPGRSA